VARTRIAGGVGCSHGETLDAFMTSQPGKQGPAVERKD
jgi:hypothetical protein